MKAALKFSVLLLIMGSFLFCTFLLGLFFTEPRRRRLRLALTSFYCRILVRAFSVQPTYHRLTPTHGNVLMVGNHLSYLDVIILFARVPTVFVTSVEVRDSGLLGLLCKGAGCIFVERRNASSLMAEVDTIANYLREGFSVFLFPEATTSSGDALLPFRRSLFNAAIIAHVDVVPFAIAYRKVNGRPIDETNRSSVYYFGDDSFFPHLFRCLRLSRIEAHVFQLPRIPRSENQHRKDLCDASYRAIENCLQVPSLKK